MAVEVRSGGTDDSLSGPLRIAAFRSAALHLLPAVLERLASRHPQLRPEVRVVRDVGRGTAGEVADGRVDLAITTLYGSAPLPDGLLTGKLMEEAYAFVHPSGHPDPRSLPFVDWQENCSAYTRDWWSAQDWLPRATITAEDDERTAYLDEIAKGNYKSSRRFLGTALQRAVTADLEANYPNRFISNSNKGPDYTDRQTRVTVELTTLRQFTSKFMKSNAVLRIQYFKSSFVLYKGPGRMPGANDVRPGPGGDDLP